MACPLLRSGSGGGAGLEAEAEVGDDDDASALKKLAQQIQEQRPADADNCGHIQRLAVSSVFFRALTPIESDWFSAHRTQRLDLKNHLLWGKSDCNGPKRPVELSGKTRASGRSGTARQFAPRTSGNLDRSDDAALCIPASKRAKWALGRSILDHSLLQQGIQGILSNAQDPNALLGCKAF